MINNLLMMIGAKLPIKFMRHYLPGPPPDVYTTVGIDPKKWCTCDKCGHPYNEALKYVFQTKSWNEASFNCVILTKVHRQKDQQWVDILSKIKVGDVDEEVLNFLEGLRRPLDEVGGVKPTKLYTHRVNVQSENDTEFRKLKETEFSFRAQDSGIVS